MQRLESNLRNFFELKKIDKKKVDFEDDHPQFTHSTMRRIQIVGHTI